MIATYFEGIGEQLKKIYKIAREARKQGHDPAFDVEIPLVKNMAERVEGLISVVSPQIIGSGISKRINELEKEYGALDWRIALTIAEEIASQKFCKFASKHEAMIIGIRVGIAYITMGTVSSPLEGFVDIKVRKRKDNKEYLALFFSGPIRSAGGTGASVSVLIADYIRKKLGYEVYDPTEPEIKRIVTELYDYHERISNLQYLPSEAEIKFLIQHLPVQIDGDPSETIEVSNHKDLERIETNNIRNGVCLVIGEGIAQKAPKLVKQLVKWGDAFGLGHWNFLKEFVELQKKIKAGDQKKDESKKDRINPDYTFIKDLVAGRPVLTHPLGVGGFRLRYGRSRASGYSAVAIHPATMHILNRYIAIGTQLKVERPGKAAVVTSCDTIEGPIVKLANGDVVQISSAGDAKKYDGQIKEILFLGDMLISYGDFFNRAHMLVPPGYCEEWWVQELEKAAVDMFGTIDVDKMADHAECPKALFEALLKSPLQASVSVEDALSIAKKFSVPLHPAFTYHWKSLSPEELLNLLDWLSLMKMVQEEGLIKKIVLPLPHQSKRALEVLGIPHLVQRGSEVIIEYPHAHALAATLPFQDDAALGRLKDFLGEKKEVLESINALAHLIIRDKSGIFIGARMGRPEKAKMRMLTGSPQILFPVGEEGGRMRSFQSALAAGFVTADFPLYYCPKCEKSTIYLVCENCGKQALQRFFCKDCGELSSDVCQHGLARPFKTQTISISHYFSHALKLLGMSHYPDLIKGVRGTSNKDHSPEILAKGILRAKHDIYVNKDGTVRYDITQVPLTHVKPKEIEVSIEKLKVLGYEKDIEGRDLVDKNQVIELFPQDIVLPSCDESPDKAADDILFSIANFVDDELRSIYHLDPFYDLKSKEDLIGQLVMVIAPHTSAGIVARIAGFSKTQSLFAHPLLHAATRRDCDGDESCVILLLDALLNFSRKFLPAHRGSTQDAPLVLTSQLIPSEVDDMVFDLDIGWRYPLEFYNACLAYKSPWEVKIPQILARIRDADPFGGYGFTHGTANINQGVRCSAYKILPSMEDKLQGQMDLAEKIRAVKTADVADLVIGKHFLKDIKGNLRKFSTQEFRCVKCNTKFRRPPLLGKCHECSGRIIFTISEGFVTKYLALSINLAEKYGLSTYLKQTLELTKRRIESVFGKDADKQEGLAKWVSPAAQSAHEESPGQS